MKKTNEITIARKAIRKALSSGSILLDTSAMHVVGMQAIAGLCANQQVCHELAWIAVLDVKLGC